MKIRDIPRDDRPMERLEKIGTGYLSNAELLAIILQRGTNRENAIDMSNRLLSKYGISKLPDLSLRELQEVKGIGPVKASQILSMFEFSKRCSTAKRNVVEIRNARDVYDYIGAKLKDLKQEHFVVLCLDSRSRITKEACVSIGTLNGSLIHPREVFKAAIRESANAIIIVHNHPSGVCKPSAPDEKVTETLIEAGRILDIDVLDHIIVGDGCYYSFKEDTNMPNP